jgi:hypothetical protein
MTIAIAAGVGALVALSGGAGAEMAAPAPKAKTVTVTGCATKGVPDFCVMMKGPKGTNYNVTGANPAVPIGKRVRLKGETTDKLSPCGGVVLDNIKWMAVRGKCPK